MKTRIIIIIVIIIIIIQSHLYPQRLKRDAIGQGFKDVTDRRKFVKNLGIELQSVNGDEDDLREALLLAIGLVAIPDRDHSSAGALYPIIDSLDEMLWHFQWRYVTSLNVRRCQRFLEKKVHSLTGFLFIRCRPFKNFFQSKLCLLMRPWSSHHCPFTEELGFR